jgi:hypothetical protein
MKYEKIKRILLITIFLVVLTLSITGCQAKTPTDKESGLIDLNKYMKGYCKQIDGGGKGVKPDKNQPYCIVANRIEYLEYAENWDKAITQSVYYAKKHNKKIVKLGLVIKDFSQKEKDYVDQAARSYKNKDSEIKILMIQQPLDGLRK